jgi:signal transduction histidine kinase
MIKHFLLCCLAIILLNSCINKKAENQKLFNDYYTRYLENKYLVNTDNIALYKEVDSVSYIEKSQKWSWFKLFLNAEVYRYRGEFQKSILIQKQAINALKNSKGTDSLTASSYQLIGIGMSNLSIYDSAIFYLNKAEKFYLKANLPIKSFGIKTNKAKVFFEMGKEKEAQTILDEVIDANLDMSSVLVASHLKANILGQTNRIEEALKLDYRMLKKYKKTPKVKLISPIYNNLANCYYYSGKLDSALFYCNQSYSIDTFNNDLKNASANLQLMGNISYSQKNRTASFDYFQKAINGFSKTGNNIGIYSCYMSLLDIYKREGDFKKAIQMQDSAIKIKQLTNNAEIGKTVEFLNIEFESEKKDAKIYLQNERLRFNKRIQIILLVLFIIILIAVYVYFKNRSKFQLLKQLENSSLQIINAEQKERMRIASELHDSIGVKLSVLKMYSSSNEQQNKDQIELLDNTIQEVRQLSHKLMPEVLSLGLYTALNDLCQKVNLANNIHCVLECAQDLHTIQFHKEIEVSIYRIVQEILNNSLKHSQANNIVVKMTKTNNLFQISIQDNGVGFDTRSLNQSKGIGWGNILTRARIIKAEVDVASDKNGTHINLFIAV